MLSEMWEVGKALWKEDAAFALKQLSTVPWPVELNPYVAALTERIVHQHLQSVARTYGQIPLATIAQQLGISDQYAAGCKYSMLSEF